MLTEEQNSLLRLLATEHQRIWTGQPPDKTEKMWARPPLEVLIGIEAEQIRLALGELPGQVVRKMLGEFAWLVALGMAIGMPASILLGRAVASLLYGVAPTDLPSQCAAIALLASVGLVASLLPALRASRIEPLTALRCE